MRAPSWAFWYFTAFAAATNVPKSASLGVVEVNLAFPQNRTYATSQHLPVIFAVQNPELALYLQPQVIFEVRQWSDSTTIVDFGNYDMAGMNLSSNDPHYEYHGSIKLDTEGVWQLSWTFSWSRCADMNPSIEQSWEQSVTHNATYRSVVFTTEKSSSPQDLDIVAVTRNMNCPNGTHNTGAIIDIADTRELSGTSAWRSRGKKCAVVPPASSTTTGSCLAEIDSAAASRISASMAAQDCRVTSTIVSTCKSNKDDKSTAHRLAVGAVKLMAVAVGASGFLMV